jgi:flagellin-like protein
LNILKKFDYIEYNDAKFNLIHISNEKLRSLYTYFRKDLSRKKYLKRRCREKMKFTKLLRNKKAISPIFATLILIAIAVIAGIVVYMFTSGTIGSLTGGGTTAQEKVSIQALDGVASTGVITVYAQSTGGGPVALDSAIVKDSQGDVKTVVDMSGTTINADLTTFTVGAGAATMTLGQSYTVTLVSVEGGNFPSQSFKAD